MGPVVTDGSTIAVISSPYAGITRSGSYGRRPQAVLSAHSACAPAGIYFGVGQIARTRRYPHPGPSAPPRAGNGPDCGMIDQVLPLKRLPMSGLLFGEFVGVG